MPETKQETLKLCHNFFISMLCFASMINEWDNCVVRSVVCVSFSRVSTKRVEVGPMLKKLITKGSLHSAQLREWRIGRDASTVEDLLHFNLELLRALQPIRDEVIEMTRRQSRRFISSVPQRDCLLFKHRTQTKLYVINSWPHPSDRIISALWTFVITSTWIVIIIARQRISLGKVKVKQLRNGIKTMRGGGENLTGDFFVFTFHSRRSMQISNRHRWQLRSSKFALYRWTAKFDWHFDRISQRLSQL